MIKHCEPIFRIHNKVRALRHNNYHSLLLWVRTRTSIVYYYYVTNNSRKKWKKQNFKLFSTTREGVMVKAYKAAYLQSTTTLQNIPTVHQTNFSAPPTLLILEFFFSFQSVAPEIWAKTDFGQTHSMLKKAINPKERKKSWQRVFAILCITRWHR